MKQYVTTLTNANCESFYLEVLRALYNNGFTYEHYDLLESGDLTSDSQILFISFSLWGLAIYCDGNRAKYGNEIGERLINALKVHKANDTTGELVNALEGFVESFMKVCNKYNAEAQQMAELDEAEQEEQDEQDGQANEVVTSENPTATATQSTVVQQDIEDSNVTVVYRHENSVSQPVTVSRLKYAKMGCKAWAKHIVKENKPYHFFIDTVDSVVNGDLQKGKCVCRLDYEGNSKWTYHDVV